MDTQQLIAEILNACWWVRYYSRPGSKLQHEQAVLKLGATVRNAFDTCHDYEELLLALVDGLMPSEKRKL